MAQNLEKATAFSPIFLPRQTIHPAWLFHHRLKERETWSFGAPTGWVWGGSVPDPVPDDPYSYPYPLRSVTCHMESESVSCHLTQVNASALTLARQADIRFTYPIGMKGWVDLDVGYIPRWSTCPQTVTHPSSNHLILTRPGFSIDLNFQDVMTSKLKNLDDSVHNLEVMQ